MAHSCSVDVMLLVLNLPPVNSLMGSAFVTRMLSAGSAIGTGMVTLVSRAADVSCFPLPFLLPRIPRKKSKIIFGKMLKNKYHHRKVLFTLRVAQNKLSTPVINTKRQTINCYLVASCSSQEC